MSKGEKESVFKGLASGIESVSEASSEDMFPLPDLSSDCSRCAALCCAAFAFERSDMFAVDKPVDVSCPHLSGQFSCKIHDERIARGFRGCTLFDCHGAGQRVTQEIFAGRNWRDEPTLAAPMFEAFRKMLKVHDYLRLVAILESLPLTGHERREVSRFRRLLNPESGWDMTSLDEFEAIRVISEFEHFAARLKDSPAAAALQARFSSLKP